MGWRYVLFRSTYELSRKTGLLKKKFPVRPEQRQYITLSEWKNLPAQFFFESRESLKFQKNPTDTLKRKIEQLRRGKFLFFNAFYQDLGTDYNWLKNPDSGFQYSAETHWSELEDYSQEAGDIKYLWEKSRFSYFLTIIRYDYHFSEDCASWVFDDINSWISANPLNCGPNFICSQEISLRLLNWLFALYYYKNSPVLDEDRFDRIMHYIQWQLHHVRQNIHFSRIAVRNNHAITETMMLYLGGIFFPFFPEAKRWSEEGLKWLQTEIEYQVYEDGTFLQFSHNYSRVLVQLLTWLLYLSELNNQTVPATILSRSQKALQYLYQCQIESNGYLPNYGANDGALFFPLNDTEFRDYRPQLNALFYYFNRTDLYNTSSASEDRQWYSANTTFPSSAEFNIDLKRTGIASFPNGGYYVNRDADTLTFTRCGNHKDRPGQADNLHLDIWYKGVNIIRDCGSYKYNSTPQDLKYFFGTMSHNTVMLGDYDQMEKGSRFIWFHWSQSLLANIKNENSQITFRGKLRVFQHVSKSITHERTWKKKTGIAEWHITDHVNHDTTLPIKQIWHLHPSFHSLFIIQAKDEDDTVIDPTIETQWYSEKYGVKEPSEAYVFYSNTHTIKTVIKLK